MPRLIRWVGNDPPPSLGRDHNIGFVILIKNTEIRDYRTDPVQVGHALVDVLGPHRFSLSFVLFTDVGLNIGVYQ